MATRNQVLMDAIKDIVESKGSGMATDLSALFVKFIRMVLGKESHFFKQPKAIQAMNEDWCCELLLEKDVHEKIREINQKVLQLAPKCCDGGGEALYMVLRDAVYKIFESKAQMFARFANSRCLHFQVVDIEGKITENGVLLYVDPIARSVVFKFTKHSFKMDADTRKSIPFSETLQNDEVELYRLVACIQFSGIVEVIPPGKPKKIIKYLKISGNCMEQVHARSTKKQLLLRPKSMKDGQRSKGVDEQLLYTVMDLLCNYLHHAN